MEQHITRYKAEKSWKTDSIEICSAAFKKRPKSWLMVTGARMSAFDYKTHFNGVDPPGYASPREAMQAWIEQRERTITRRQEDIDRLTGQVARAKKEHAELLSGQAVDGG